MNRQRIREKYKELLELEAGLSEEPKVKEQVVLPPPIDKDNLTNDDLFKWLKSGSFGRTSRASTKRQ